MAEYIEREAAYNVLSKYYHHSTELQHEALREAINKVPAADVQPVVHGKWIKNEGIGVRSVGWHCSVCKEDDIWAFIDKGEKTQDDLYCPNCGARMDGEESG